MNNVEKAEYLMEGILDLQAAIRDNHPFTVPKKLSLRVRLKKVLEGTRGSEIYEDLEELIPISPGFEGDKLIGIAQAIKASRTPSLTDAFKARLVERDLGM